MSKLLVNAPTGAQDVIEVGEGGSYFDSARVLWDERVDGPLPEITLGGMVRVDDSLVFSQARFDEHTAALRVVPPVVSMAQARKALILGGITIASVDAAIAAIADDTERALAETDWQYATEVRRNSPLVQSLTPALGLSEQQVDDLFIAAASL